MVKNIKRRDDNLKRLHDRCMVYHNLKKIKCDLKEYNVSNNTFRLLGMFLDGEKAWEIIGGLWIGQITRDEAIFAMECAIDNKCAVIKEDSKSIISCVFNDGIEDLSNEYVCSIGELECGHWDSQAVKCAEQYWEYRKNG